MAAGGGERVPLRGRWQQLVRPISDRLMARYPFSTQQARDLVFVPRLGVVVCFISKNASSFLKAYIAALSRGSSFQRPTRNPHVLLNTGFMGIEALGPRRFSEILSDDAVPKVVVGREPIERLMSAFVTRVQRWHREQYDSQVRHEWVELRQAVLGTIRGQHASRPVDALASDVGWEALVQYVTSTPSGLMDRHLVPQTDYAATADLHYHLVGGVESLDEFLGRFCQLVDRPFLDAQGIRVNVAAASPLSTSDVTSQQRAALHRRYAADYEFFGYRP